MLADMAFDSESLRPNANDTKTRPARLIVCTLCLTVCAGSVNVVAAQSESEPNEPARRTEPQEPTEPVPELPQKVEVEPVAQDRDIESRLLRILDATEWFAQPAVTVDQGVVFLSGLVDSEAHKEWAGELATKTQDVVAVVNRMTVVERSIWDLSPTWNELTSLAADTYRNSPLLAIGFLLLLASWWFSRAATRIASRVFKGRMRSELLRDVAARAVAVPVFIFGLYLVLKVSGLTRLAVTVLGGTGLVGLVVGFAFRDIAENFLASLLISIQHPFSTGDLIEVAGQQGFVQSVNTRCTLLMTLEGNHVQIPNATIYKDTITNFTANPHVRVDFVVGIGYDDSTSDAQAVALRVLQSHDAVVDTPEPMVLVETLGAATVNLRAYFWIDAQQYSPLKVRSAVLRLTKSAFENAGISMPDEAREVVFPEGIPVSMQHGEQPDQRERHPERKQQQEPTRSLAEGDLSSEANAIEHQARLARSPEAGADLLGE